MEHVRPADIERTSMALIREELARRNMTPPPENAAVVMRVIHATADFDYAENLRFTGDAANKGAAALAAGTPIITDTNMARAGISRPAREKLGCPLHCFMADPQVAETARKNGTTRAAAAMDYAAEHFPNAVLAVGNGPTALLRIADRIEAGLRPALVIGVPVGFVNVVEAKERVLKTCEKLGIPAIVSMGRKGGSTVAVAIVNALIYTAGNMLDPGSRGWD